MYTSDLEWVQTSEYVEESQMPNVIQLDVRTDSAVSRPMFILTLRPLCSVRNEFIYSVTTAKNTKMHTVYIC